MKTTKAKAKAKTVKARGIRHHNITRVMYVALVAFMLCTASVVAIYSNVQTAQATVGAVPFGGILDAPVLTATPSLTGICPAHIVVTDLTGGVPKIIGITYPTSPFFLNPALVFDYHNITTPGVWQLGEYLPTPVCFDPYPVFPALPDPEYGPLFEQGTGLIPGA